MTSCNMLKFLFWRFWNNHFKTFLLHLYGLFIRAGPCRCDALLYTKLGTSDILCKLSFGIIVRNTLSALIWYQNQVHAILTFEIRPFVYMTVSGFSGSVILRNQPLKFLIPMSLDLTDCNADFFFICLKISEKLHEADRKHINVWKKNKTKQNKTKKKQKKPPPPPPTTKHQNQKSQNLTDELFFNPMLTSIAHISK